MNNPKNQTIEEMVESLMTNTQRQYTEAAHAEIYNRLIQTIKNFNAKAEKIEKVMLFLATALVILALTQLFLALR